MGRVNCRNADVLAVDADDGSEGGIDVEGIGSFGFERLVADVSEFSLPSKAVPIVPTVCLQWTHSHIVQASVI